MSKLLKIWNQIKSFFKQRFKSLQKCVLLRHHKAKLKALFTKNDFTDINRIDSLGWSPMHRAIVLADIEILEKLIQNGANPNLSVNGSPLCKAIFEGNEAIVVFLIENGADVNLVDGKYWTPLKMAIKKIDIQILKILLQNGASPNMYHKGILSPLHRAIFENNIEIVTFLIENGADVRLDAYRV